MSVAVVMPCSFAMFDPGFGRLDGVYMGSIRIINVVARRILMWVFCAEPQGAELVFIS